MTRGGQNLLLRLAEKRIAEARGRGEKIRPISQGRVEAVVDPDGAESAMRAFLGTRPHFGTLSVPCLLLQLEGEEKRFLCLVRAEDDLPVAATDHDLDRHLRGLGLRAVWSEGGAR